MSADVHSLFNLLVTKSWYYLTHFILDFMPLTSHETPQKLVEQCQIR